MAEAPRPTVEKSPEPGPAQISANKPKLGDIVWVRASPTQSVPAIVVNDYSDQNAPDTLGVLVFLATPFESNIPIRLIPDVQRETRDIPLDTLTNESYRWWRNVGDKGRDLAKEREEFNKKMAEAQTP